MCAILCLELLIYRQDLRMYDMSGVEFTREGKGYLHSYVYELCDG